MPKKKNKNKIAIIGTGYVGLVTGACFAEMGQEVICIDKDQDKVKKLKNGNILIYEPGLKEMVKRNIKQTRLFFSADLEESIQSTKIIFICVGTPSDKNGKPNLSYIKDVSHEIGKNIKEPKIIVTKSTVPIGTGKNLVAQIISKYFKGNFEIASNPEFLREGSAVSDFLRPDRIVIGTDSLKTAKALLALYKDINCPKIVTTVESAEMIKYAANAFLATKISFINEIANTCEKSGADVEEVARGVGLDKRIGKHFLKPGIGYGGSCLPKDVRGLRHLAGANGYRFRLLESAIAINNFQKKRIIEKIKNVFHPQGLQNKTIAVLGLAFKDNTDDIRYSAAIDVIKRLQKSGAKIRTFDPKAMENAKIALNHKIEFCRSPYEAVKNADLVMITTEWSQFKKLNWKKIKNSLKKPIIVDGRNLLDPLKMKALGFRYIGVGRNV